MALFKSPIKFRGIEEGKVFLEGEEIEMTIKRANEIQKNLKDLYDLDVAFERLDIVETKENKNDEEAK